MSLILKKDQKRVDRFVFWMKENNLPKQPFVKGFIEIKK